MAPRTERFPIRFDRWFRGLSTALLLPPEASWMEVSEREVEVRMGYAFRARFPRSAVHRADQRRRRILGSRGVHGFAGRWLVNGSAQGLVTVELGSPQRARVLGFPVRLRELVVSVERPTDLVAALTR
jgi:hypothetical protein